MMWGEWVNRMPLEIRVSDVPYLDDLHAVTIIYRGEVGRPVERLLVRRRRLVDFVQDKKPELVIVSLLK